MLLGISGDYYPIPDCLFQGEISLPIAFWELKLFSSAYIGKQLLILLIGFVWAVFFLHNSQIIRHLGPKNHQAGGLDDCGWKNNREGAEEGGWVRKCRHVSALFSREREAGWGSASTFQHCSPGRGMVGLSNSCQVWSHPGVITELSFCSFFSAFFDYLNFTNYFIFIV